MGKTRLIDITGQKFGRLTAIRFDHKKIYGTKGNFNYFWFFKCDCGKETITQKARVMGGFTTSCGCYFRETKKTHGNANTVNKQGNRGVTPSYGSWLNTRSRCNNPNNMWYRNYGGRGIKICDRWNESFENFLADMGERPAGKTLDRIDNDGNYEPGNCKWSTPKEQSANRRKRS